jgi:hypothetical protein
LFLVKVRVTDFLTGWGYLGRRLFNFLLGRVKIDMAGAVKLFEGVMIETAGLPFGGTEFQGVAGNFEHCAYDTSDVHASAQGTVRIIVPRREITNCFGIFFEVGVR